MPLSLLSPGKVNLGPLQIISSPFCLSPCSPCMPYREIGHGNGSLQACELKARITLQGSDASGKALNQLAGLRQCIRVTMCPCAGQKGGRLGGQGPARVAPPPCMWTTTRSPLGHPPPPPAGNRPFPCRLRDHPLEGQNRPLPRYSSSGGSHLVVLSVLQAPVETDGRFSWRARSE